MELNYQVLFDEREISNKLSKFVRILDKRQWDGLGEMFSENVVFDYAEGVERQGLSEMRNRISSFLANCGPTHHLLGSLIIEVDGDTATSRAYIQSRHNGLGERSNLYFDANGEYVDQWERQETGWIIVKRLAINMFQQGDFGALGSSQTLSTSK